MRYLFDTHILLWAAKWPHRLPSQARAIVENAEAEILFSAASLWEIAIKRGLGRAEFQVDSRVFRQALLASSYIELAIEGRHAVAVEGLPTIHKDPFDRILIAQAMIEEIVLITADPIIARYPGPIRLV